MKKQDILTVIFALFPSYVALVTSGPVAALVEILATILLLIIICNHFDSEKIDDKLTDKLRLAIILHMLGVCVVIGYYNI